MKSARPHIVLEGPDGAGKTTLAKSLVETRGYAYHHEGLPPAENMLIYYARQFQVVIDAHERPVIFDRLHLGELVYGEIIRGHNRVGGIRGLRLLELLLQARGAVTILCLPPEKVCIENWFARKGQEYVQNRDIFSAIYANYKALQHHCDLTYDYTSVASSENFVNKIVWNKPRIGWDFIGDPWARVVFFGDRANQVTDLPFFSVDGSSGFLHDCIAEAGYDIRNCLFANCNTPAGEPHELKAMLDELADRPRNIVALGTNAFNAVVSHVKPSSTLFKINHPQFIKRFYQPRVDEYVSIFRKIFSHVPRGERIIHNIR
jgi:thymidylate kinase